MARIFAANWKLFKNPAQARLFFSEFNLLAQDFIAGGSKDQIVFFPSAICLEAVSQSLSVCLSASQNNSSASIQFGAQNVYCELQGAFTGENSAQVVKDLGAGYVLIGHSERRSLFAETDALLAQKVKTVQALDLTAMLCIGESLEQRKNNETLKVLTAQLKADLSAADPQKKLVVAYEPIWAIGTGQVASLEQVAEAHQQIHAVLKEMGFNQVAVLYGGSVKADNAKALAAVVGVDGFLVGGASLEPATFWKICQS